MIVYNNYQIFYTKGKNMSFIVWDSSLSVGIDIIDEQHKQIIDSINKLDKVIKSRDSLDSYTDELQIVINDLINYTVIHFNFEEEMLEKANYQFFNAHKKAHDSFAGRVLKYQERLLAGEDVAKELVHELKTWLLNHIKREDKDYAKSVGKLINGQGWFKKFFSKLFG